VKSGKSLQEDVQDKLGASGAVSNRISRALSTAHLALTSSRYTVIDPLDAKRLGRNTLTYC
jgi:hypothetical protein